MTILLVVLVLAVIVATIVARVSIIAQRDAYVDARHALQRCIAAEKRVTELEHELAREKSLHRERVRRRSRRSPSPEPIAVQGRMGAPEVRAPLVLEDSTSPSPETVDNV